ncbi:MAG: NAD(P)-dependent oxidoreductase [Pyrinomonadaceae bacterium]
MRRGNTTNNMRTQNEKGQNMSDISIIGLGSMGTALARALLNNEHRITIWNRTSAKAEPLVRDGAVLASSAAAAVSASPTVIVCVTDYASSYGTLDTKEVTAALKGKVLIQLSSGTPQDARDGAVWAQKHGVEYLDGAIMATPIQIGRPDTPIFLSGTETTFRKSELILKSLAGNLIYMGEAVGSASAWDMATLCCMFGAMFGFFHGARICEEEGLRVDSFGSMIAQISPVIGEMIKNEGEAIQAESYGNPEASMEICAASGELFLKQAREARINAEFPVFLSGLFNKAMAAGYGSEKLASMIKVLRNGA